MAQREQTGKRAQDCVLGLIRRRHVLIWRGIRVGIQIADGPLVGSLLQATCYG